MPRPADGSRPPSKIPKEDIPQITYRYNRSFVIPQNYCKYIDKVFQTWDNFDFNTVDYEISDFDVAWLKGQKRPTAEELVKIIDVFEKIWISQGKMQGVVEMFFNMAGEKWKGRITKDLLNHVYTNYWMPEKEKRKRPFSRIFWDKHDLEDNDPCHAFRRRIKDRMTLRRKTKMELDCYKKMAQLRKQSVDAMKIFQEMIDREIKKKQGFQLDKMLNDNIMSGGRITSSHVIERDRIMNQSSKDVIELKVSLKRDWLLHDFIEGPSQLKNFNDIHKKGFESNNERPSTPSKPNIKHPKPPV